MKSILAKLICILLFLTVSFQSFSQGGFGLDLTWPLNNSVTQRGVGDVANVIIAGQLLSNSSSTLPSTLTYSVYACSSTGTIGALITTNTFPVGVGGVFYKVLTMSKGWYILKIQGTLPGNTTPTPLWSSKFGVGDVFVIAGQSNAKGKGYNTWVVPPIETVPDWIVLIDQGMECLYQYPSSSIFSFSKIGLYSRIAPTGENSWCYAVLGKKISDANGGMPVAFFNTAYGGSGIRNWYESRQGGATNDLFSGNQYCSESAYPAGQPYKTLKITLNYYSSMFGIRALIWHQGETETAKTVAEGAIKDATTYASYLNAVISQSRTDFNSSLSWIIAKASYNVGVETSTVISAQGTVATTGTNTFLGPNTDNKKAAYRFSDNVHFTESANNGLTELANDWKAQIDASGTTAFMRVIAGTVPTITVTKSGSNRTLTAPSGANEYRWGLDINTAVSSGTTNFKTYVSPAATSVQCFVRKGNNWTASAKISIGGSCTTCREGEELTETVEEKDQIVNFNVYPNPAVKDVNISFNVLKEDLVKLELIDGSGRVLRTFANGPHAKGTFKYPVSIANQDKGASYFCRVTIGQTAYTKRLIFGETMSVD